MKKLVKTAKQQFEEDLNNLTLVRTWKMCDSEIYHHCVNGAGHFILFREQDEEYKILIYHKTYEELVLSEEFLFSVTQRFIDGRAEIKQLYNWYASADHEDEPFNLLDVYMSDLEAVNNTYEDEYEEVPDVRIITAKEQWEEDSKSAKVLYSSTEKTLKVYVSRSQVVFYDSEDIYSRSIFPSLEVMRNDALFVGRLTESMSEANMYDDIAIFLRWVRTGGDFPLPLSVIYHSEYSNYKFEDYEDKELPQEQPIEEKYFSTEITDLKERMINYILEIYDRGLRLNSTSFLENSYAIIWASGCYYDCANIRSVYLRESVDNGFELSYECKNDAEGDSSDSQLEELSIETLAKIIDSMY